MTPSLSKRLRRLAAPPLAVALIAAVASSASAAPGDLDASFGTGGIARTDFAGAPQQSSQDIANDLLVMPGGKILAAGRGGPLQISDWALARYNADGSLDTGFGTGGKVVTPFSLERDLVRALALQSSGKIIAAGMAEGEFTGVMALARYNTDGSLDTSFGVGGKVTTDLTVGLGDGIRSIAIQPDDKIIASGAAAQNSALVRYNPDGTLDTSFGNGGKVIAGPDLGHFFDLELLGNGKIVIAGTANLDFVVARFNSNGTLDTSFGSGGKTTTDFFGLSDLALDMAVQADGRIVAAGWADGHDPFGTSGDTRLALARYHADGRPDTSFGSGGTTSLNPTALKDGLRAVTLQPNGNIVAAGVVGSGDLTTLTDPQGGDIAVVRYRPDGTLDAGFGSGGIATTDSSSLGEDADAVTLQPDGNILVGGGTLTSDANLDFVLARYRGR